MGGGEIGGGIEDDVVATLAERREIMGRRSGLLFAEKLARRMEVDAVRFQSEEVGLHGVDVMMRDNDGVFSKLAAWAGRDEPDRVFRLADDTDGCRREDVALELVGDFVITAAVVLSVGADGVHLDVLERQFFGFLQDRFIRKDERENDFRIVAHDARPGVQETGLDVYETEQ